MSRSKSICFITFAGSPNETDSKYLNIAKARQRIILQAEESGQFVDCIGLDWLQLSNLCVEHKIDIPATPHRYSFTPILLKLISLNAFGNYQLVLYAGSGCEINTNFFAKKDLNRMVKTAKRNIFYVEHNLLPELQYTKKEVFIDFQLPLQFANTPQICATFFLVSCTANPTILNAISNDWLEYSTRENGFYISSEFNPKIQDSNFQAHRNDQSLFSVVLKKYEIRSNFEKQRNFVQAFPAIRGSTTFIWTNRNRSGVSKMPDNIHLFVFGLIAISIEPLLSIYHRILTHYRLSKNFNREDYK